MVIWRVFPGVIVANVSKKVILRGRWPFSFPESAVFPAFGIFQREYTYFRNRGYKKSFFSMFLA